MLFFIHSQGDEAIKSKLGTLKVQSTMWLFSHDSGKLREPIVGYRVAKPT